MPAHRPLMLLPLLVALGLGCRQDESTREQQAQQSEQEPSESAPQNGLRDAQQNALPPASPEAAAATPEPRPALPAPEPGAAADFQRRIIDVVKHVQAGVVTVTAEAEVKVANGNGTPFGMNPFDWLQRGLPPQHPDLGTQRREGMGSGLVVSGGYILTNNHVVEGADTLNVIFSDDRSFAAEIVGTDPKTDVAVLKLKNPESIPAPLSMGDSDALEVGQWVVALGAPFGLKQTVSAGIVSAVGRGDVGIADYEDFVQTDAAINPGNSGGPLVDLQGRVIGINTAIASRSGGSQGIGFAIPVNMVNAIMSQLIEHGHVVRSQLGVYITALNRDMARSFNYQGKGILIQDVAPESPAKGKLQPGDIVTALNGREVTKVSPFRNQIATTAPGTDVDLTVIRDGQTQQVSVKLAMLEDGKSAAAPKAAAQQGQWGIALGDVTPELKQRLKLQDESGAVVMQVQPGSPAERSNLQPGDVIVQVQGKDVNTAQDAQNAMVGAPEDQPLRLRVIRDGRGTFLILSPKR